MWSSIVDDATFIGTADEVVDELAARAAADARERAADALRRAREHGSSDRLGSGGWGDAELLVGADGVLPRGELARYVDLLAQGREAEAAALTGRRACQ